jgi:uncharacterized protein (TIGR02145 family)
MKIINKFFLLMVFILAVPGFTIFGQVSVTNDGSAPGNSAMLDVKSTNKGFLPPRMTTSQRNAIAAPEEGLMIFNITTGYIDYYFGGSWKSLAGVSEPVFQCGMKVTDVRDGKLYNTVKIGNQCWMAENMNVGNRLDSTVLPTNNGIIEKFCFHDLEANCSVYGGLYTWHEIMQYSETPGIQGICPAGWHIPADAELTALVDFLGGTDVAADKMKEAGTAHWLAPNLGTNESGFTGLGTGMQDFYWDYSYWDLNLYTFFWSSTLFDTASAYGYYLGVNTYSTGIFRTYSWKNYRMSVRCLQN